MKYIIHALELPHENYSTGTEGIIREFMGLLGIFIINNTHFLACSKAQMAIFGTQSA
jgi:hypothetical protein